MNKSSYSITTHLDALGLLCPEPVMMLHQSIRSMQVGEIVEVLADDPSTLRDVPKFCLFLKHELVYQSEEGGQFIYHIKKCALE